MIKQDEAEEITSVFGELPDLSPPGYTARVQDAILEELVRIRVLLHNQSLNAGA